MKSWLPLFVLLYAVPSVAQPIHNHPQKTAYASPAEWPTFSSQEHWLVNGASTTSDPTCATANPPGLCAHIHDDLTCPYLAELDGSTPIRCNFSITLHHFPGHITGVFPGFDKFPTTQDVVFDAMGSSTMPDMTGDPLGDKTWTGHFSVQLPALVQEWWFLTNVVYFQFDNGDQGFINPLVPIWSTHPVTPDGVSYHLPVLRTGAAIFSAAHPEVTWGLESVEYDSYLPIMPISVPWQAQVSFYSYGRTDLLPGIDQLRADMDLHHLIPGTTLMSVTQATDLITVATFDPVVGTGTHKFVALRVQPDGDEQLTSLLVNTVTVDPNAPPITNPPFTPPPSPPPPPPSPPPPPALLCSGTITGTSADGTTITVTGGTVICK